MCPSIRRSARWLLLESTSIFWESMCKLVMMCRSQTAIGIQRPLTNWRNIVQLIKFEFPQFRYRTKVVGKARIITTQNGETFHGRIEWLDLRCWRIQTNSRLYIEFLVLQSHQQCVDWKSTHHCKETELIPLWRNQTGQNKWNHLHFQHRYWSHQIWSSRESLDRGLQWNTNYFQNE